METDSSCAPCDASCLNCIDTSTKCISCDSPNYLESNICKPICSSNKFGDVNTKECLLCDASCLTCNGSTAANCLSCVDG